MNRRKALGRLGSYMFVFGAERLDDFALPLVRKQHEQFVRKLYGKANETLRIVGLPQKTFKRLNSKGRIEEVR